jgi:3-deoxy-D-manno-octulosonate 8-phosphate phosphatase (KDO 8-P phosphatase)
LQENIIEKAKKIKLLILDVDGVLTDGKIYYGNYGDELKAFDVKDGMGLALLTQAGIETAIITAKKAKIIRLRAKDMGIKRVYENHSKAKIYARLLKKFRLQKEEVCFIGDDLLDVSVLKDVGLAATVPGAPAEVRAVSSYITRASAGSGAVRELCEFILKSQGKWDEVIKKYT